jgi:hypothetical protein
MHTFLFGSYDLILASEEEDLIRDVGYDMHKARTKLARVQHLLRRSPTGGSADRTAYLGGGEVGRGNRRRGAALDGAPMNENSNIVKFTRRKQSRSVPYSSAEFAAHLNELGIEERLDLADKLEGIAAAIRRAPRRATDEAPRRSHRKRNRLAAHARRLRR